MTERRRAAPLLMALSGASALAYETIWMRQLTRAFGITVYAIAGLVALYMGGLALGAALMARRRGSADWLRVYGILELAAGVASLAATLWLSRLPAIVAGLSGQEPLSMPSRLLLTAPALLPPTILLGATLPALTRDGVGAALLYGTNTLGAFAGLLAAAFLIIGAWGESATIMMAASINVMVAAASLWLSRRSVLKPAGPSGKPLRSRRAVPFFIVSGFCALGCEVLWSRQLIPLLGNSTYAFALILAVYLAGLGIGSCIKVKAPQPWAWLAALLGALGASVTLSAASVRFIGMRLDSSEFLYSPLRTFADFPQVGLEAVAIVAPTALVLGLLFPVALEISGDDAASVGRLYAWNTIGGIAGSLVCGFAGISLLGGNRSLLLLGALAIAASLGAATIAGRRAWWPCAGFAALTALLFACSFHDPAVDILSARWAATGLGDFKVLFHDESPAATIVGLGKDSQRILFINGIQISGKSFLGDFMSLLPNVLARRHKNTLVICFGAGNTFRDASLIGSADAVELVGDVVRRMPSFHDDASLHLHKPDNHIFIEDGRNYLLRSSARYDVIVVDAAPPLYSAGAVNLYTSEFFALARNHLTNGGVFTLWLPTDSFESDYWQILRSFCDSFPHAAVWSSPYWDDAGFLVLGSRERFEWPRGELERRLRALPKEVAPKDIDEKFLRAGFWLSEADLRARVARYEALTDDKPTVEFPLARFWRGEEIMRTAAFLKNALRAEPVGAGDPSLGSRR